MMNQAEAEMPVCNDDTSDCVKLLRSKSVLSSINFAVTLPNCTRS